MKKYEKQAVFEELKKHCIHAGNSDYIEVTEWKNGEGFDVEINAKINARFQLTWGEFDALKLCISCL